MTTILFPLDSPFKDIWIQVYGRAKRPNQNSDVITARNNDANAVKRPPAPEVDGEAHKHDTA